MARKPRDASTRGMSTRATEEREIPAVDNSQDDPLHIPYAVLKRFEANGYKLGWVRRAAMNMEDGTNVRQRALQGWKPVPADMAQEMTVPDWDLTNNGAPASRHILVGGSVLCMIPKKDFAKMVERQAAEAHAAVNVPFLKVEGAPSFDDSKTSIERVAARVQPGAFKED